MKKNQFAGSLSKLKSPRVIAFLTLVATTELFVNILPLRVLDTKLTQITVVLCILQAFLMYGVGRIIFSKNSWQTNLLIVLPFVFCVFNYWIYFLRIESAFQPQNTGRTSGQIIQTYKQVGSRSPESYYIKYQYQFLGKSYIHAHAVDKKTWTNANPQMTIEVMYNLDDPELSRIVPSEI